MRFTGMYIATLDTAHAREESERLFDEFTAQEDAGDGLVDSWIEAHFDQPVRCLVCGQEATVNPQSDDDMVVMLTTKGGEIIACEPCLSAVCVTAILSMEQREAQRVIGQTTAEIVERTMAQSNKQVSQALGGLFGLETTLRTIDENRVPTSGDPRDAFK